MTENFECEQCLAHVVEWHEKTEEVARLIKRLLRSKRKIKILRQRNQRLKNTVRQVRKIQDKLYLDLAEIL